MRQVVWIAGSGTDVGKTWVAAALIGALRRAGRAFDVLKPVVSGIDDAAPEGSDPARLLAAMGRAVTPESLAEISPLRFRAPLSPPLAARLEGRELTFAMQADLCRDRAGAAQDLLLIETAGGVMSPVDETRTGLDLMAGLPGPVVLVTGGYLGTISHTLTALAVLRARGLPVAAIVVSESAGDQPPFDETVASLEILAGGAPVIAARRGPEGGWNAAELAGLI